MAVKTENRRKKLRYQRIELGGSDRLGELLAKALEENGKCATVTQRQEEVTETVYRLLNHSIIEGELFIAELVQFEIGKAPQALKDTGPDASSYDIAKLISLPGNEHIVDSSAYICILEEDMLILSSQGFSVKTVYGYLSWLLKERIGFNESFRLFDLPDLDNEDIRNVVEGDDYVTSIKFGSQIGTDDYTVEDKSKHMVLHGSLAEHIKTFLFANFREQFTDEDMGEWSKISVGIEIRYSRPKKKTDHRPELINLLGDLNEIDDDLITLKTKQGKTLKGKQIRLDISANIPFVEGNVDFQSLKEPMTQAMEDAVRAVR